MANSSAVVAFRCPATIKKWLEAEARRRDRPVSYIVLEAVKEKRQAPKAASDK